MSLQSSNASALDGFVVTASPADDFATLSLSRSQALLDVALGLAPVLLAMAIPGVLAPLVEALGTFSQVPILGGVALLGITLATWRRGLGLGSLGLRSKQMLGDVAWGFGAVVPIQLLCGIWSAVLLAGFVAATGLGPEDIAASKVPLMESVAELSLVQTLLLAAFVGFYEEVLFRGFVLGRLLAASRKAWLAIGVSAVIFAVIHAPGQGWFAVLQILPLGAALAWLSLRRRSVWPAILCHAGFDAAAIGLLQLLKGAAESGALDI
jgi:membrane protease YdiL (CAAX protease family)